MTKMTVSKNLIGVNLLSLVVVLIVAVNAPQILRIIFGVPFLAFFPGYALKAALMPKRHGQPVETLAFSIALSLAVVPLIGLLLNYTPWGIRLETVLYAVASFTLVTSVVAWFRLPKSPAGEAAPSSDEPRQAILARGARNWVAFGIMVVMVGGALGMLANFLIAPKHGEQFTTFYLVNDGSTSLANTPAPVDGAYGKVTVKIVNHEGIDTTYRVEVLANGQPGGGPAPVFLTDGQAWQGEVTFLKSQSASERIELYLYKNNETTAYLGPLYFWTKTPE